jgi:hypothetical protein
MTDALHERLNKVLPRVAADEFIAGRGLGNEVAFHIFDYPPERELEVRGFIPTTPAPTGDCLFGQNYS